MQQKIERLKTLLARVEDLSSAAEILEWDQETYMPDGGAEARAHQIATLRKLAHEFFTDDEVGTLLDQVEDRAAAEDPLSNDSSLVRVTRRDYDKALRIPPDLVAELARAVALAKQAWKTARQSNQFDTFAPHLQNVIELNVRKAEALGYEDRIYDALLDQYEPGMRTAEVERVFSDLRRDLVPIVHALSAQKQPDDSFLHLHFDRQKQWDVGMEALGAIGYDFNRGRQDFSPHPFTTSFSITDVRITTRIQENFFPTAFFGTLHEGGHALYEQGISMELERTPLADGTSMAMHESQSRMWENLVGRSRSFWKFFYPRLQTVFPEQLRTVPLDDFYRAINRVNPSLIRVESDEVTYNLHIMLRFELENMMLEGKISVNKLPDLWNTKMVEYLGIQPDTDANGVLQDVHWSLGAIGYFPTYALGNLMSAQLFDRAKSDLPSLDDDMAGGRFEGLLGWLRTNIHQYGRKLEALEILQRVTGKSLEAQHWLDYVRQKYSEIYQIAL